MSNDLLLFDVRRPEVPREYFGNMCGVRVLGLPPVPGGAADASLVLSWFIDRYSLRERLLIYAAWKTRGDLDVLVSWPDSQDIGRSPEQFVGTCLELAANGFRPCAFLSAKPTSSDRIRTEQETLANIMLVLPLLIASQLALRVCIGWELSLWLTPADVEMLTDAITALTVPAHIQTFPHFQEGYFSFQPNGQQSGAYWQANVGKLTGILHQRDLSWDMRMYQARIVDCLQRFAGQDNCPADSGFKDGNGTPLPFAFVALEITAQLQFDGDMDEATGNAWGQTALTTPGVAGPFGLVTVVGSGNGF